MAIQASCDCGHRMKLNDSAAGKRIRCPECSGPIDVPENDLRGDEADDNSNDYEDDGYEDDYDEPRRSAPSRGSRRPQDSGSRGATRKTTRSRGGSNSAGRRKPARGGDSGLGMGLAIGGGAILLIGGIVFGVMFLMNGKGDDDTADNVARANNSAPSSVPNTVANNGQTNPVQPNNSQPNAVQPNVVQPNPGQTNPAQPNPANNANANGKLWAVLSNFKSARGNGPFNKSYTIDYRLVSGAPAETSVVLYISEGRSSVIEHYMEVNLDLRSSGSVTFQVGSTFGIGGRLEANLAIKEGRQKWKPISGKISVGGGQTTSQVPQSVAQKAGASGKGKAVVLANARTESSIGRTVYLVDYVVNQRPVGGFYFLVIKDSRGQGIEFDISSDLRRAQIGKESEFSGRPIGLSSLSGQITAHVEKRSSPSRSRSRIRRGNQPAPTIISNTATFK